MKVVPYSNEMADGWNELVSRSNNSTFLHTRKFLSYHGDKFRDCSLLIFNDKRSFWGVFPAALAPDNNKVVVSHPGITYGGIVHAGRLRGKDMIEALREIVGHYYHKGFKKLVYKAVPYIYHRIPSQDDLYALFRVRAKRYRCDLSSCIDLRCRGKPSKGHKWALKKSRGLGLQVSSDSSNVPLLWKIIQDNLKRKYNTKPVHSLEEILLLYSMFPENIDFVTVSLNEEVLGGVVLFISDKVMHTQYIAATEKGHVYYALNLVIEHCINRAEKAGIRYFDFGISNENAGWTLNEGLFQFKANFGAGSIIHEFYELDLEDLNGTC